jgi:hypothetical protein
MNKAIKIMLFASFLFIKTTEAQLYYLASADSTSYFCEKVGATFYPKYGLKKTINQELYLNDKLISDRSLIPNGYTLLHYEIYNDSILFITFLDNFSKNVDDPVYIKRGIVDIIYLSKPYLIYSTDLKGISIVKDNKHLLMFIEMKDFLVFTIKDISSEQISMLSNHGLVVNFSLQVMENPIIK